MLSFFWSHIKPYKWYYLIMLLAPIINSFYPFAYNYAIKLFLDGMTSTEGLTYQNLLFPIILFLGAQVVLDVTWRVSNIAEWLSEPYVRRSILLNSYDYVQHHAYTFFQNNFTGSISSKLKGILDGYDRFWSEMHHGLLAKLLKCTVNLCALCLVNPNLGVFVFLWSAAYVPIMYRLSLKLNRLSFAETESRHALIGQVSDKITNIASLFSFSAWKREKESLDQQISEDFIPKQISVYKCNFKIQVIGGILCWIMFVFLLFYMIHLRMIGLISVGEFAFVFGIALVVTDDIWHATVSLQDFSRAMGDWKSALSILSIEQNRDPKGALPLQVRQGKIEFRQVNFGYDPKTPTLSNLNLLIKPGEKIGLVGHSGAGKTSLINLLLRYFESDAGRILIDDQDIAVHTQDSLRENIAIIPQDTMLFHRTLMENIRFGRPNARDAEVIEASKKAHLHEYIMQLPEQYAALVGERGLKLSGGQRQRVAIARAILKDAPILILDEATSALDSHTEKLIQEALNVLIEDKRKTVIAIAHRLSTLKHMHRVIVLDQGVIVEEGSHSQLISKEHSLYKKLWELQEI